MSSNLPATTDGADIMEAVITKGDLGKLTPAEKVEYYAATCRSLGLNPLTKPFDYLTLSGKTVLYAGRTATDQLRKINGVSIVKVEREERDGVLIVTATARDKSGREDSEIGAVNIGGLKGDALANAWMKATTKAKRRVTLSICGLGWLDGTEVETIPHARTATVDVETGEIVDAPQSARNAPRAIEAPEAASDDPQRALAALHAAAAQYDIGHDAIHALFAVQGYASVKDVPPAELRKVTDTLNRGKPRNASDRQKIQDRFRAAVMAYEAQIEADAGPGSGGMDAEDYAQVVAAIDADVQEASVASMAGNDRWTN